MAVFSCPTLACSSDYNIFGYDPNGFLAYLCAYFFGPSWRPKTFEHLPQLSGRIFPPRFGPPSPQQTNHLPEDFEENPPPMYYGRPYPPYLPGPQRFDRGIFAALGRTKSKLFPKSALPIETANGSKFPFSCRKI